MKAELHRLATGLVVVAVVFGLAACSETSKPQLSSVVTGVTDEPAPGYESVQPGSEEDFILTVGRRIYFSSGSAELDSVARETLDIAAAWLSRNPAWLVKMQGFADDPGGAAADVGLSDRRAQAVMSYLVSKGVDPQRLWAKGYGRERLVRECPELACKAQNRRVVMNLRKEFDAAAPQYRG